MIEVGDRMLIPCRGGPSVSRLVRFPPALEIAVDDGVYVLVDDGPPEHWCYDFIARADPHVVVGRSAWGRSGP